MSQHEAANIIHHTNPDEVVHEEEPVTVLPAQKI